MNYEKYIHRCIELARRGEYYVAPNPMVGAVLVERRNENGEKAGALSFSRLVYGFS